MPKSPLDEYLEGKNGGSSAGKGSGSPLDAYLDGKRSDGKKDKGLLDKIKSGGGNLVGSALNALDIGRAAVVSTAIELGDGARALAGKDAIGDHGRIRDRGFSLQDIVDNTRSHVGVGDVLETPGVTEDLPINVKRALGFVGDVALDPTTYLTAGATAGAKGAAGAGRLLSKDEIVRGLMALGDDEVVALGGRAAVDKLANEAARGVISREAAEAIGARTGMQFQVGLPGVGSKALTVPGTSTLTEGLGRAGAAVREGAKGRLSQGLVEGLQSVPTEGIRRADREGLGSLDEFRFREGNRQAATAAGQVGGHLKTRLSEIVEAHPDVDLDEVRRAIETGATADVPMAKALADLFEEGAVLYEQATGKPLARRTNYLTHLLTEDGKKVVEESTKRYRAGGKQVFEHARALDGTIDELNQAALERFGKDAIQLLETNPVGIAAAWTDMVQRAVRTGGIEKAIADQGLADIVDKAGIGKAVKSNRRLEKRSTKAAGKAEVKQAEARTMQGEADEIRNVMSLGDADVLAVDERALRQADRMGSAAEKAQARADGAASQQADALARAQEARLAGDGIAPTKAEQRAVETTRARYEKAQAVVEPLQQQFDEAAAELRAARKAVEVEKKRVYGANRTATARAGKADTALSAARERLSKAKAAEGGASKRLADARRELTNASKALDAPAAAAVVEPPEVVALRAEKAELPAKVKAAEAALAEAEKGLEFGITAPGRQAVDAAIAKVDEAQTALDDLLERAKYIDEDIDYAISKGGAPEGAVDTSDLAKAVEAAGIKVSKAEGDKVAAAAARQEAEAALTQLDEALDVTPEQMDPALRAKRDQAKKALEVKAAKLAKAQAVLEDAGHAFDTASRALRDNVAERAEANLAELERLKAVAATAGAQADRWEAAALRAREKADEMYAAANVEPDAVRRSIALLEAESHVAEAKALAQFKKANDFAGRIVPVDAAAVARYQRVINENMVSLAGHQSMYAHPEVADAVMLLRDNLTPKRVTGILKAHDQILSRWKAWSLLSPGYHGRNFMGAMFMNGVAGMDGSATSAYLKFGRSIRAVDKMGAEKGLKWVEQKYGREYAQHMGMAVQWHQQLFDDIAGGIDMSDALNNGNRGKNGLAGGALRGKRNWDITALDFAAIDANFKLAGKVERLARGPLFIDGLAKGMDPSAAFDRVVKFHFDYSDLSRLEQDVVRRVIPFYTWMRKNFPLQLEMMAKKPGYYTRYTNAKRNIEAGTEQDSIVPAYFRDLLAIRTPFKSSDAKNIDGGQANVYLTPDLPFVRLAETFDTNILLSQLSPIIKTPIEVAAGKTFFAGIPFKDGFRPAPKSPMWEPILATLSVADGKFGLPDVERNTKTGEWMISDKDAYKIEQFLPILGRMRRVAPSEERYQERQLTTWMSTFLGVGARTNGEREQEGEQRRIEFALSDMKKRADELAKDSE